jgi:PAS domain S-box-containing protein
LNPARDLSAVQIRLSAALAGTSRLKEGLRLCLDAAMEVSGLDCGGIFLVDPGSRSLRLEVHHGVSKAFVRSQKTIGARSPFFAAAMRAKPIFGHGGVSIPKYGVSETSPERRENLKATAAIPILARKRVVACLNLASHTKDEIPPASRRALEAVASQIGLSLLRLRAMTALRQSEAKYRKLINNAGDAIVLADAETGKVLDGNNRATVLFGRSLRELRALHQSMLHPPAEAEKYRRLFRAHIDRRTYRTSDGLIRRKDGRDVPVEISSSLIEWGGRRMLQGFFRDMTERRKAERRQARSRDALRRLTARLVETQENERRRIARELHDEIGQALAGLGLMLNKMRNDVPDGHALALDDRLGTSVRRLEEITGRIRAVIADLRPPLLDDYGLAATLEWAAEEFTRKSGLPATTWIEEGFPRLKPLIEIALARIVGEALTNVQRHARAARVVLSLEADEHHIYLIIKDDGIGFSLEKTRRAAAASHWGLAIMRERVEAVGGKFRIVSAPGTGTQVLVEVPR